MNISGDLNETFEFENTTQELEVLDPVVHDVVYIFYFGFLILGCIINFIIGFTLLTCKRNGILSLVLQLTFVDALSAYVGALEIWSIKSMSWNLPSDLCPLFAGSEVLTNTLTLYLILSLNFHIISLMNLQTSELQKNSRNPLTSCNEDDSNECLVKRSENASSRNIVIGYRKRKNDVSVMLPSILVWFISLSISIPKFTLASTIKLQSNYTLCAVVDTYFGELLQKLLLVFRVGIPEPLLIISLLLLLMKLYQIQKKQQLESALSNINNFDSQPLLIFAVFLTLLYLITSTQRDVLYLKHTVMQTYKNDTIESFRMPPFHNIYTSNFIDVWLSMWHYSSIIVRPLVYVLLLPSFRALMKKTVFSCFNIEE